jgi:hypothetical protein
MNISPSRSAINVVTEDSPRLRAAKFDDVRRDGKVSLAGQDQSAGALARDRLDANVSMKRSSPNSRPGQWDDSQIVSRLLTVTRHDPEPG